VPVAESRQVASAENLAAATAATPTPSPQTRLIYRVKRGDTLSSIADLFKTSVASLRKWNGLRTSHIAPGDRLTIFKTR
jgi:LysM repeat protein